jgi:predicted Zn-dependent protease
MKKISWTFTAAALAACFFALALTAFGQGYGDRNQAASNGDSGTYAIQGRVIMPDGTPAKHIRISYTSTTGSGSSSQTDDEGMFRFSNIPSGNYTVMAKMEGMPMATESLIISREGYAGQSNMVVLYLRGDKNAAPTNPMLKDVPKDALTKFEKAIEKNSKNDPKGAIASLDEAIATYPDFAYAYYQKGEIYTAQNDLDNAMVAFQKAIAIKPDYIDAKMSYGTTLLAMKNYELAAPVFQDVIKQKNDVPMSYVDFGRAMLGMNKLDVAEKAFKYALTVKGGENLAIAHRFLGGLYLQQNKNAEAAAELQKYLDMNPNAPDGDKLKSTISGLKKKG